MQLADPGWGDREFLRAHGKRNNRSPAEKAILEIPRFQVTYRSFAVAGAPTLCQQLPSTVLAQRLQQVSMLIKLLGTAANARVLVLSHANDDNLLLWGRTFIMRS